MSLRKTLAGGSGVSFLAALIILTSVLPAFSQAQTPVMGHYPPGQSGIRGAFSPDAGIAYTNFSRFFSNLEVKDANNSTVKEVNELRYANINMFAWTTNIETLGMRYGVSVGIPFSTGNINPSAEDAKSSSFGLGDILITPLALYGKSTNFDYQFQFTVWTPSGRFSSGATNNRGLGYWELVYSLGGVYYPDGDRQTWSFSGLMRIEQNCEQKDSGIKPGNDIVIDWGVGRIVHLGGHPIDAGLSGFGAWQITSQTGGAAGTDTSRYRFYGIGPEASMPLTEQLSLRIRAQWEFGGYNVVQGNNLWIIFNYRF